MTRPRRNQVYREALKRIAKYARHYCDGDHKEGWLPQDSIMRMWFIAEDALEGRPSLTRDCWERWLKE